MRSVMVTKFVPSPPDSGGKLRSLAILRRLAERGETVLCCFADDTGDVDAVRALGVDVRTVPWRTGPRRLLTGLAVGRSGSTARFYDPLLARHVAEATREAQTDVLQVEYAQLAPYLHRGRARLRVLDLHNVESALARSYARSAATPRARLAGVEAVLLRRVERAALRRADLCLVVSQRDRERVPAQPRELLVCPNGWEPAPVLPPAAAPIAVFVALLSWQPNVDAARWLAREVWPEVSAAVPQARLLLVGRDPTAEVRALAGPGVEVTGTVPDVRPYLAQARVALAPLRAGGGSRLKVLEALAAGRPVVATGIGVEGLEDLVGRGVTVADETGEFAQRVVELLTDPAAAQRAGCAGADAVQATYSWDATLRPWTDRLARLETA